MCEHSDKRLKPESITLEMRTETAGFFGFFTLVSVWS